MNKRVRASWSEPYLQAVLTGGPFFVSVAAAKGNGSASPARPLRTASDIRRIGNQLWIAEDDSAFVVTARLPGGKSPVPGSTLEGRPELLYPDAFERHGTGSIAKAEKPDTECLARFEVGADTRLLALCSGSTPRRRQAALIDPGRATNPVIGHGWLDSFFTHLAVRWDIVGTELNLEGAVGMDGSIRFLQRGNGQLRAGRRGHNSAFDITVEDFLAYAQAAFKDPSAPFDHETIRNLYVYELGVIEGERLTFSGADELGPGWALYAASAEQSPDVYQDGPTVGAVLGLMAGDGRAFQAPLKQPDGSLVREKVEGIAAMASAGDTLDLLLSVDPDADRPAPILPARIKGPLVARVLEEIAGGRSAKFERTP